MVVGLAGRVDVDVGVLEAEEAGEGGRRHEGALEGAEAVQEAEEGRVGDCCDPNMVIHALGAVF